MWRLFLLTLLLGVLPCAALADQAEDRARLGMQLFFDVNLSANRTQSCATCHQPDRGFVDPRGSGAAAAASLGDDGHSLGDRNAPSAAYAVTIPTFHRKENGRYAGGLFLDGRADTLADQAGGPPLNPLEMGMPDQAAVLARLKENPVYQEEFARLYGDRVLQDAVQAYAAMTDALAAFESTDFFAPYDSKYDRFLRGEYELTPEEELGRVLFFSRQFTNCNQCHQLHAMPNRSREMFTNFEYHNIGVPANAALRRLNGVQQVDEGLLQHPAVTDPAERGKFRTPSLRNVAVTGPYMHNGVFQDLRTVVLFYNHYNSRAERRQINPETGARWAPPEVPENLSMTELTAGPALDDRRMDALVAFMKTLTDQRYEHLLEQP